MGTPVTTATMRNLSDAEWEVLERIGSGVHLKEADLASTPEAIVQVALETIKAAQDASVGVLESGQFLPLASESRRAVRLNAMQRQIGSGPSVDAARGQRVVVVADVVRELDHGDFRALAIALGVRSLVCVPVQVDATQTGAISLFSDQPAAFPEMNVRLCRLLARQSGVALGSMFRARQFRAMALNRDTIGRAKGILMERHGISDVAAFAMLRSTSQDSNTKLLRVAENVVGRSTPEGP